MATLGQHTIDGAQKLLSATFEVTADWAYHATSYHTVTLSLRKPTDSYNRSLAEYGLNTRSLTAYVPVTIYTAPAAGLDLEDGDRLIAELASSGSPAALSGPAVVLQLQKIVR